MVGVNVSIKDTHSPEIKLNVVILTASIIIYIFTYRYGSAMMIHAFNQLPSSTRCRPVADGCEIKWVYRNDETRECTDDERFMVDDLPRPMI